MRSDELCQAVRDGSIRGDATAWPDFPDSVIRREMNAKLWSVFTTPIVEAGQGYWLKQQLTTTTVGKARYRIPARACIGGLAKVEIQRSDGSFLKLDQVATSQAQEFQGNPATYTGKPYLYTLEGDRVELIPVPNEAVSLRFSYYLRPSQLVQSQSSTQGGDSVVRGQITVVDTTLRQLTVNVVPFDQLLTVPAAITTANQRIDVVSADGWHEVVLVGSTQTLAGSVFTLPVGTDMSDIEVGMFVRVAEQTDWPCLPDDFHRSLADVTAVKILLELAMEEKAAAIRANVENDLARFKALITPRVKADPPLIPLFMGGDSGLWSRRY